MKSQMRMCVSQTPDTLTTSFSHIKCQPLRKINYKGSTHNTQYGQNMLRQCRSEDHLLSLVNQVDVEIPIMAKDFDPI